MMRHELCEMCLGTCGAVTAATTTREGGGWEDGRCYLCDACASSWDEDEARENDDCMTEDEVAEAAGLVRHPTTGSYCDPGDDVPYIVHWWTAASEPSEYACGVAAGEDDGWSSDAEEVTCCDCASSARRLGVRS